MIKRLKVRRKELKLSQSKVARLMGVHVNTYARWERGVLPCHEGLVCVTTLLLEMVGPRKARRLIG